MARRSSRRRSSSRSKGRKSSSRRSSRSVTTSGHSLPIVPLAIAAVGGYFLWQRMQGQKAAAAEAAATAAAVAAGDAEARLLPSLT